MQGSSQVAGLQSRGLQGTSRVAGRLQGCRALAELQGSSRPSLDPARLTHVTRKLEVAPPGASQKPACADRCSIPNSAVPLGGTARWFPASGEIRKLDAIAARSKAASAVSQSSKAPEVERRRRPGAPNAQPSRKTLGEASMATRLASTHPRTSHADPAPAGGWLRWRRIRPPPGRSAVPHSCTAPLHFLPATMLLHLRNAATRLHCATALDLPLASSSLLLRSS